MRPPSEKEGGLFICGVRRPLLKYAVVGARGSKPKIIRLYTIGIETTNAGAMTCRTTKSHRR